MTSEEKRELARELFLYTEKSQQEIAQRLKVTEPTVSKWKRDGQWSKIKSEMSQSVERSLKIVNNVIKRAYDISEKDGFAIKDIRDAADAIDKFMPKKSDFSAVNQIGQNYIMYLMEEKASQEEVDAFIESYKKFSNWYLSR